LTTGGGRSRRSSYATGTSIGIGSQSKLVVQEEGGRSGVDTVVRVLDELSRLRALDVQVQVADQSDLIEQSRVGAEEAGEVSVYVATIEDLAVGGRAGVGDVSWLDGGAVDGAGRDDGIGWVVHPGDGDLEKVLDLLGSQDGLSTAEYLKGQRPLGMFPLPRHGVGKPMDMICCYEKCAARVNSEMEVSGALPIQFLGKVKTVAIHAIYLILFHDDFVEIRNAVNGELQQIIAGENIRCLDDGQGQGHQRNVLMVMAHPDLNDRQLVLELVLTKGKGTQ